MKSTNPKTAIMFADANLADRFAQNATPFLLRMLNWLADRDGNFREAQKLRAMPEYRLADMGLTRIETRRTFGCA